MEQIEGIDVDTLTEAAKVWTGSEVSGSPNRDDARVTERFGGDLSRRLLAVLKQIDDDAYGSDARHRAQSVEEMAAIVARDLRAKYPNAPDDLLNVFGNCYAFDYR